MVQTVRDATPPGTNRTVLDETRLKINEAVKEFPGRNGDHVTRQTLRRWCVVGMLVNGVRVRLEARRVGSTWYTSKEAIQRWLNATNPGSDQPEPGRTPGEVSRSSRRAGRELARKGL